MRHLSRVFVRIARWSLKKGDAILLRVENRRVEILRMLEFQKWKASPFCREGGQLGPRSVAEWGPRPPKCCVRLNGVAACNTATDLFPEASAKEENGRPPKVRACDP